MQRTLDSMKRMIDQLMQFTLSMADVVPASRQRLELDKLGETVARDTRPGTSREIVTQLQPGT